jgi:hypothetical protein
VTRTAVIIQITSVTDPTKFAQAEVAVVRSASAPDAGFLPYLYKSLLGRAPDNAGSAYWQDQMNLLCGIGMGCPVGYTQIALAFFNSAECQAYMNNRLQVAKAYLGLLDRPPDPQGIDFWAAQLAAGMSVQQMIQAFVASPEFWYSEITTLP